jgi:hypothetical protein
VTKNNNVYEFSATSQRDPYFSIPVNASNIEGKKLKFDVNGSVTKEGGWARLAVMVYSNDDAEGSPSIVFDPITVPAGGYDHYEIDLSDIDSARKVQFMLITDKGTCDVKLANVRFE